MGGDRNGCAERELLSVAEMTTSLFISQVADAVAKPDIFCRLVKLHAFQPFVDAEAALANASALSEGVLSLDVTLALCRYHAGLATEDLINFLTTHFPATKKSKGKKLLAVAESRMASAITEALPHIGCVYAGASPSSGIEENDPNPLTGAAPQYMRGIRVHFEKLVGKLSKHALDKSQLSLGHSYSRAKVRFFLRECLEERILLCR